MNVEVLGNDVEKTEPLKAKAAFPAMRDARITMKSSLFSAGKQLRKILPRKVSKFRFGDDIDRVYGGCADDDTVEMMGGWFSDVAGTLVNAVKTVIKSPTGKALGTAIVGAAVAKMTPTQKAQLAQAQTAAGMTPQALSDVSGSQVAIPTGKPSFFAQNAPWLIIGGVTIVGGIVLFATMKKR